MFVGDFKDDITCGRAAGNVTCLLLNDSNGQFKEMAHLSIDRLDKLIKFIEDGFEVSMNSEETEVK